MLFNSCLVAYMMRVLLSISILAMVEPMTTNLLDNDTIKNVLDESVPDVSKHFFLCTYQRCIDVETCNLLKKMCENFCMFLFIIIKL